MLLAERSGWEVRLYREKLYKPVNNVFIFLSREKLAYKWVCLRNFAIELAYATFTNHSQKNLTN